MNFFSSHFTIEKLLRNNWILKFCFQSHKKTILHMKTELKLNSLRNAYYSLTAYTLCHSYAFNYTFLSQSVCCTTYLIETNCLTWNVHPLERKHTQSEQMISFRWDFIKKSSIWWSSNVISMQLNMISINTSEKCFFFFNASNCAVLMFKITFWKIYKLLSSLARSKTRKSKKIANNSVENFHFFLHFSCKYWLYNNEFSWLRLIQTLSIVFWWTILFFSILIYLRRI